MNNLAFETIKKYVEMLSDKGYITKGFVAVKENDGMFITKPDINFNDIKEEDIEFITDKNIEKLDGNFRAAAVILFCVMRQDKKVGASAIVDSDAILKFSSKDKTLLPILDDMAQIAGITVKCASSNTAAEVVSCISGMRNACFLKDAGAVISGRTLDEVFTTTLVLDKACNAEILAADKGGTKPFSILKAIAEHLGFKLKYSKTNQSTQKAAESGGDSLEAMKEDKPSAIVTDEQKKLAQDIKDAGIRLLEENLVQGTWGNIGVLLNDKEMLATPSGLDYVLLQPDQMAIVDLETGEWTGSHKPTSERGIHAELLKADKNATATLHTHPFYGSILCAMYKSMPVPEKYRDILGDEIPCAKGAIPGTKALVRNTVEAIGNAPACFLANHGVIAKGKDLNDAFKVCRALEDACRDYLLGEEKICDDSILSEDKAELETNN